MIDAARFESLSVYRGQSRTGQGEGPGKPVLHGEQYMRVDPPLYDSELLEAIRPWMTLDSDPADHQRLNDQLEAWSLFPAGDYLFVARLASAGVYDRRAAYFAHGRAWKRGAVRRGFDPALHLGRSVAFDTPWRDERPAARVAEETPSVVRVEQVAAEAQTAARFLGNLLQAMNEGYPLVVAAPVADFASGSALHALIAIARAGLPVALHGDCRIRVYSRFPELFLRHLGVHLIAVPDEAAPGALTARPTATLIDREGRRIAGKNVSQRALDYATAVVERAVAIPDGLPHFTERVRDIGDVRSIPVAYNIAFALAGPPDRRAELLRRYLPRAADKLGPGLPWDALIGREEWREFPDEALLDELLSDASGSSSGRRELLRAAEDGVARLGLRVDARLPQWWDARDPAKVARLLELLAHDPPLVSRDAAAERTAELPLEELVRIGAVARVLEAEAQSGWLSQRAQETTALARAATDASILDTLRLAVSNGRLDPAWARTYVATASREELVETARRWLGESRFFEPVWADVPVLLVDRLRGLDPPPVTLALAIASASIRLSIVADLGLYLRLADLLTRIDIAEGNDSENALVSALWKALPLLSGAGKVGLLEDVAFDPAWCCIRLTVLEPQTLLHLATHLRREESLDRVYAELDRRIRVDAEAITEALVRSGWWYFWRRRSRLVREKASDAAVLRRSALAWLGSRSWGERSAAEATLESWDAALADLPAIEGHELARLRASGGSGARVWPCIPPFEDEQFAALIRRAADLGALAELVEAVHRERRSAPHEAALDECVLAQSRFKGKLPRRALGWLLDPQVRGERPLLTLDESSYLHTHAGHRLDRALEARIDSVAHTLDRDLHKALRAAGDPDLWSDGRFLSSIADWMNGRGSLAAITNEVAKMIDDHVDGEPDRRPRTASSALVRELVAAKFKRAARLLHPELSNDLGEERLADDVIAALIAARPNDRCWQELANLCEAERANPKKHPLEAVTKRIRSAVTARDRKQLAANGWRTFVSAARRERALVYGVGNAAVIAKFLAFAAAMLPPGAVGNAALQIAFGPINPAFRGDVGWWQGLIQAMRGFTRYGALASADDRDDVALALIYGYLEQPAEQHAFARALKYEPKWWIPNEFGEGMS